MAEFKRLLLAEIFIPERLRAIDEDHALAIANSFVEHGQINPITVRKTPAKSKGATPYTLVAGGHRIRAAAINEDTEIDSIIVEADQDEALLIEITENLFRNELSVIDRAVFVQTYREVWEKAYGKIEAGRPGNRINLIQLFEHEAGKGFSQHVADRMGISVPSLKRLNQIAQNLHPDVRAAVRGTPIADNQSALINLAKMEPKQQRQVAIAFKAEGDLKKAIQLVVPPPVKATAAAQQSAVLSKLVEAWEIASEETRDQFLQHIGMADDGMMATIVGESGE
ncbi:ParB N-terminal domain-containing protein [Rhizobium sp. S163]|uniref:ParB N-terminal domain-containing protein n=1 Tax=Rhizobium sp. S163 TaxID=3055039 RepID=UPI0025A9D7FF|nr:ParB N-terminal domain-containing protein [Rhizobium sp. S163]MDM9647715.1 ParB N-terminal domain-containing protein [Rhizobium sp. S163]